LSERGRTVDVKPAFPLFPSLLCDKLRNLSQRDEISLLVFLDSRDLLVPIAKNQIVARTTLLNACFLTFISIVNSSRSKENLTSQCLHSGECIAIDLE
jgi:hypothetical protein